MNGRAFLLPLARLLMSSLFVWDGIVQLDTFCHWAFGSKGMWRPGVGGHASVRDVRDGTHMMRWAESEGADLECGVGLPGVQRHFLGPVPGRLRPLPGRQLRRRECHL
jgi:hypothetical protein